MSPFTCLSTFPLSPHTRYLPRYRPITACLSTPSSSTPEFPKPIEAVRSSSAAHIYGPVTEDSKQDGSNGYNYAISGSNGSGLHPLSRSAESNFERIIFDFRFFVLFAIGGSLAGSLLCFLNLPRSRRFTTHLSSPSSSSTTKFPKPVEAIRSSSVGAAAAHIHSLVTEDNKQDGSNDNYAISSPSGSRLPTLSHSTESNIERIIFDFRFFALFAIGGSLAGSLLCFLNGCVFIYEAYKVYWTSCVKGIHSGQMVLKLVEAIDVYLAGTVMLIFGMGLYGLFISNVSPDVHPSVDRALKGSSLFGMFALKERPRWMKISSLDELKTKVGHVIVMILLVKMFERSKTVVIATGLDLLSYSVCIFLSSASLYILHNLHKE